MNFAAIRILSLLAASLLAAPLQAQPAKLLGTKPKATQIAIPKLLNIRVEIEKHPDGSTKKETPYLDGKIHGDVKEYWPGGKQLKSLTHYVNGLRQGNAETYFDNGRLETRTPYKNDKIEGVFERYDNPGAVRDAGGMIFQPVLVEQVSYISGMKEGVRKTWRRVNDATSGVLSTETAYKNDKREGESFQYGPGEGRTVTRWKNDLQDGLEERFSATGKSEINWKGGKKHGMLRILFERYGEYLPERDEEWSNGGQVWVKKYEYFLLGGSTKIKKMEAYNNASKLHGKSEFWAAPDQREKTLEFANGQQNGFADYYDTTGSKVIRREEWKNGVKVRDVPI